MYQYIGNSMSKNKSEILKKLAITLPLIVLSGVLPGTAGVFVGHASAEHHGESSEYVETKPVVEIEVKKGDDDEDEEEPGS
jgi:hypothetical protein